MESLVLISASPESRGYSNLVESLDKYGYAHGRIAPKETPHEVLTSFERRIQHNLTFNTITNETLLILVSAPTALACAHPESLITAFKKDTSTRIAIGVRQFKPGFFNNSVRPYECSLGVMIGYPRDLIDLIREIMRVNTIKSADFIDEAEEYSLNHDNVLVDYDGSYIAVINDCSERSYAWLLSQERIIHRTTMAKPFIAMFEDNQDDHYGHSLIPNRYTPNPGISLGRAPTAEQWMYRFLIMVMCLLFPLLLSRVIE